MLNEVSGPFEVGVSKNIKKGLGMGGTSLALLDLRWLTGLKSDFGTRCGAGTSP